MEVFNENMKMAIMVRRNYHLLPVLNRFGIRLGFKDKTIGEICNEQGINKIFFLDIVNAFHNESYFPETELLSFSPLLIIEYLKKTHKYYLDYVLPKIEGLLNQLVTRCSNNCTELKMVESFYKKYKNELLLHISDEEDNAFPYVLKLIDAYDNRQKELSEELKNFSIHSFEKEHTNVDTKLNDLKNLIIKYIKPVYDVNDCNEFLIALNEFEKDIRDHARIEDKILVPKVKEIEDALKNG